MSAWSYKPSVNTFVTLSTTQVAKWSDLNITSNSNMSISFTINIQNTNSNWRSIFHVTNSNNDCCSIGDRVPAIWITAGGKSLLIVNSTSSSGNPTFYTANISLNTDTDVRIVWSGQIVNVYFNNSLVSTYNFGNTLTVANSNAYVYICDPWYSTGGFKIKDFNIYNGDSISSSPIQPSWKYTPSENTFVSLKSGQVATWADLNITSNTNMSMSFTINIQKTNSDWRSIVHISNTNNNCCSVGDRVPAFWITAGGTSLHICNSVPNNGNEYFYTSNISLNTDTNVMIIWSGTTVNVYFNNILTSTYKHSGSLTSANSDSHVYICDPWYTTGGFTIKNLYFYNGNALYDDAPPKLVNSNFSTEPFINPTEEETNVTNTIFNNSIKIIIILLILVFIICIIAYFKMKIKNKK